MYLLQKTVSLLVLASLAVTLSACSGVKPSLTAERPKDEAFRTALYKGSTRIRGLTADILRNGPIAVSAADNYIYVTLPIIMSLSYGMFETPAISLKLRFKATARITPDWRLNTDISYVGLSDLLAEEIGIGPLSLKPRSIVEGITQPVQKALSDLISQKINEMFPLKAEIAKVWSAAQKPVLLDRSYNAWLKLTPREVMLSPLYAQNNRVKVSVGINSLAELVVGPEPAARPPVPLPNLKLVNTFDRNFRIAMNADLFYKDIVNIASPLLLNKEFKTDGKTVIIKG